MDANVNIFTFCRAWDVTCWFILLILFWVMPKATTSMETFLQNPCMWLIVSFTNSSNNLFSSSLKYYSGVIIFSNVSFKIIVWRHSSFCNTGVCAVMQQPCALSSKYFACQYSLCFPKLSLFTIDRAYILCTWTWAPLASLTNKSDTWIQQTKWIDCNMYLKAHSTCEFKNSQIWKHCNLKNTSHSSIAPSVWVA